MKQKLLLFFTVFLISHSVFSQTYANTPPDLVECNSEIFDLTVLSPIILGDQNPNQFSVSFFVTLADAINNVNMIWDPSSYLGMEQQVIFARVNSNLDQTFATTSFGISIQSFAIMGMPNVAACDVYYLPQLIVGQYFTQPTGMGSPLLPGDAITTTARIYIYGSNFCDGEASFMVTIVPSPIVDVMENVYSCTPYTLPVLSFGDYYTGPNQTGTMLSAGTVISASTNLYIAAGFGLCTAENSFVVNVGDPIINVPTQLEVCSDLPYGNFNLQTKIPEISNNESSYDISFHETLIDAMTGTNSINPVSYTNTVTFTQTVYVRVENPDGGCFSTTTLQLVVVPCTQNTITGKIRLDSNNTGCDSADPAAANIQVSNNNNGITTYAFTDAMGNYTFTNAQDGTNLITIQSGLPANFGIATPTSHAVVISAGSADEFGANNFCLSPSSLNDAAIYLSSNTEVRPGFPITYFMSVYNQGTTVINGNATFEYDPSKLLFVTTTPAFASQTGNSFTFNFTNFQPSQILTFKIHFTVQMPGMVNIGDIIQLNSNVNVANDQNLGNNTTTFSQIAINSCDPNDISVKEGATISEAQADDYLQYMIRFQNVGDADAIDVKITNDLDANLDWTTFRPIVASHTYQTELIDGQVVFRFNNINLPSVLDNEPLSNGFVMYKIKPVANLTVGDVMSNKANIYFDFNAPIATNTVTTEIVALGTMDVAFHHLIMAPNPATELVMLSFDKEIDLAVELSDLQGKLILENKKTQSPVQLNVSALESGLYFVKMTNGAQSVTKKLMVR